MCESEVGGGRRSGPPTPEEIGILSSTGPDPLDNHNARERSGSVVESLTRDRRAAGSSLTGVTALWSLSKTHLS